MKKISLILSSLLLLSACGSDSKSVKNITEDSYALQTIAGDYTSSQVVVGNLNGDRQPSMKILSFSKSDYTIDTYKDTLYHIGAFQIDTIDAYQSDENLEQAVRSFSANFEETGSANTYKLLQVSDSTAYLIQYGRSDVVQLDLTATNDNELVSARIDLSAYNAGQATSPNASGAVISGDYLFVMMQRFDENFSANNAYVSVIDISDDNNPVEIDTNPQSSELKGIELAGTNPVAMSHYNGTILISARGDYSSNSGTVEKIDATTLKRTTLLDGTSLTEYNNTEGDSAEYYHFSQIALNSNSTAYLSINVESGYTLLSTHLFELDLNDNSTTEIDLGTQDNMSIGTMTFSPNNRLWIGISDKTNPGVLVMDTDTNTQNQSYISTDLPVHDIEFLDIDTLAL